MYGPPVDRQEAIRVMRAGYDRGVTFFDVAEVYGPFLGEEMVGEALGPIRDKVVIAIHECGADARRRVCHPRDEHISGEIA
jgi:aryl-alcohol dehydrogenase-like predicted oxidoreductase